VLGHVLAMASCHVSAWSSGDVTDGRGQAVRRLIAGCHFRSSDADGHFVRRFTMHPLLLDAVWWPLLSRISGLFALFLFYILG